MIGRRVGTLCAEEAPQHPAPLQDVIVVIVPKKREGRSQKS